MTLSAPTVRLGRTRAASSLPARIIETRLSSAGMRSSEMPGRGLEAGRAGVAQLLATLHEPPDRRRVDAEVVLEDAPQPEGGGLLVLGDADPLAGEVGRASGSRRRLASVELDVEEPPRGKGGDRHEIEPWLLAMRNELIDISETSKSLNRSWRQNVSPGCEIVGTRSMPSGRTVPSTSGRTRSLTRVANDRARRVTWRDPFPGERGAAGAARWTGHAGGRRRHRRWRRHDRASRGRPRQRRASR